MRETQEIRDFGKPKPCRGCGVVLQPFVDLDNSGVCSHCGDAPLWVWQLQGVEGTDMADRCRTEPIFRSRCLDARLAPPAARQALIDETTALYYPNGR